MNDKIELEDTVECKYTGIKGIAVTKTEFVNGCIQFGVAQKKGKERQVLDMMEIGIDSQSLKLIKKGPRHKQEEIAKEIKSGGPMRIVNRMRGY